MTGAGHGAPAPRLEAQRRAAKLGSAIVMLSSAQCSNLITVSSPADKLPETPGAGARVLDAPTAMREADFEQAQGADCCKGCKQSAAAAQSGWPDEAFQQAGLQWKQNRLGQPYRRGASRRGETDAGGCGKALLSGLPQPHQCQSGGGQVMMDQKRNREQLGFPDQVEGGHADPGDLRAQG